MLDLNVQVTLPCFQAKEPETNWICQSLWDTRLYCGHACTKRYKFKTSTSTPSNMCSYPMYSLYSICKHKWYVFSAVTWRMTRSIWTTSVRKSVPGPVPMVTGAQLRRSTSTSVTASVLPVQFPWLPSSLADMRRSLPVRRPKLKPPSLTSSVKRNVSRFWNVGILAPKPVPNSVSRVS